MYLRVFKKGEYPEDGALPFFINFITLCAKFLIRKQTFSESGSPKVINNKNNETLLKQQDAILIKIKKQRKNRRMDAVLRSTMQ